MTTVFPQQHLTLAGEADPIKTLPAGNPSDVNDVLKRALVDNDMALDIILGLLRNSGDLELTLVD